MPCINQKSLGPDYPAMRQVIRHFCGIKQDRAARKIAAMPRFTSRTQLMDFFGAKQRNVVWSWCAVNDDEKKVYFSLWADSREKRDGNRVSYVVQKPHWGIDETTGSRSAARKDHDDKLLLALEHGYESYGYLVEPKNRNAVPREIESTETSFIFRLQLERETDGSVLGYPIARINL